MSMNLNNVQIVGNLVREPEVRATTTGKSVANFSLGVNESYTADNGEKKSVVNFVDVEVWGAAADNLGKLVKSGQELFIQGSLRQSVWNDRESGEKRSKLFVRADNWQFTQHLRSPAAEKTQGQEVSR
jgi:single-strand DNA-binding protein